MSETDLKVLAAILAAAGAALAAVISGVFSFVGTRRNQRDLEELRGRLAEEKSESDARRDYQYEARKRLYDEYEPLLFQLVELSDSALHRTFSLAREARDGHLVDWLTHDDYYLLSTIYRLFAPLAVVRLMQRRLTLVDLAVDRRIADQYSLAKQLMSTFADDFTIARLAGLPYDPLHPEAHERRKTLPHEYWRQGIPLGRLENAADALVVREEGGTSRCRSFGEFEESCAVGGELSDKFRAARDLLDGFSPATRPVLWRVLLAQAHLYKALQSLREGGSAGHEATTAVGALSEQDRRELDWRAPGDPTSDEDALVRPFEDVARYLHNREQMVTQQARAAAS